MRIRFLSVSPQVTDLAVTPRWLALPSRALFVGLIGFAVICVVVPWQQSSRGAGQVVAFSPVDRPQEIHAPVPGRVAKWHVVEGTQVDEGDLLVEMEDVDPNYLARLEQSRDAIQQGLDAAAERANAYARQESAYEDARELKMKAAELKVDMVEQKLLALAQKIEAAEAQVRTTDQNLRRRRDLLSQGLVSDRDVELAELASAEANAALNQARAKLTETQAEKKALQAERLRVSSEELGKIASSHAEVRKARSEEAKAREELIKLDVTLSRQRSSVVKARRAGTVLWLNGNLGGNLVKAGDTLVILVPDNAEQAVELWLDGNDVPLIRTGRAVRLQFEGWPAVQFTGWPQVAVGTFGGRVAFVDATSRREGKFRVVVKADPDDEPWPNNLYLRQGVRAQGWILLDEVALGYELWRRFNGFPPAIADIPAARGGPPARTDDKDSKK